MELLLYHLDHVNWLAIVTATLASFALGALWYSPVLFGKQWMKAAGLKKQDIENSENMGQTYILTGVLSFVIATALATLMCALAFETWRQGALLGGLIGLTFVATSRGIHMLFEKKSNADLFFINAGHEITFLVLAGTIIGLF